MTSFRSRTTAIIFDLGGVIVDLSVSRTVKAFSDLSGLSSAFITAAYLKYPEFFHYERGEITDAEFRDALRKLFSIQASDTELDRCWNAMLIGLPESKLQMVEKVKTSYSVYVLSNTNSIHMEYVNRMFLNGNTLEPHFHKCYYSHEVGMRKPESEIYKHVLQDAGLQAGETLFLDDNLENIKAAESLGIQAIHITNPDSMFDLFMNV